MKNLLNVILSVTVMLLLFTGCSSNDTPDTAAVSVKLVDAPGDYLEVNVNVQAVEFILNGESLMFNADQPGPVNLLELTAGNFAALISERLPAGRLSQIRLILGESGNTAVIEGADGATETVALSTPSAQQSGLKLNVNYDLQPGVAYDFVLDFDANRSIIKPGATQTYILRPVIRVITEAESGAISGFAQPASEIFTVKAISETDPGFVVSTHTEEATGEFLLYAVPEGTYTLTVEIQTTTEETGRVLETIPGVVVQTGVTTELGTIRWEEQP